MPSCPSVPFAALVSALAAAVRPAAVRSAAAGLAAALLAAALLPAAAPATQLIRVYPETKADYLRLLEAAPEAADCGAISGAEYVEFAADDARVRALRALGFTLQVEQADLEAFYASRLAATPAGPGKARDDFGQYHTYTEAIAAMDALAAAHPQIMTARQQIGTTIEGRPIWVYKISDNPNVDESEPEVFFNAYIHAREVITFEVLRDLAEYLLNGYGSDPRATAMVDTREIWLQPVVNPDGVEYNRLTNPNGGGMWRKNRRNNGNGSWGVDLNRNFSFNWGYDGIGSSPDGSSETYRGSGPFSEPETAAMRDFVIGREIKAAINYHSYGGLQNFAPGYDNVHSAEYDEMLELGRMRRATSGYQTGASWELLYFVNGDANDWMLQETVMKPSIPAFTTEVGTQNDGFWPQESRIPALLAENRESNYRLIELADNPWRILPPGAPRVDAPDTVGVPFTLAFTTPAPDPDNPAVSWSLIEGVGHTVGADNLEGANSARWTADGWTLVTNRSHSATHSFFGGNANGANHVLVSRRGHLVQPGEQLRFWTWYSLESGYDYGYVELATDARTYTPIPGSITTNNNPQNRNLGNGITGSSGGWVQATFSLDPWAGQTVWFRFRHSTDGYYTQEGWYVDDIEPAHLFLSETTVATGLPSAQYEFTTHPQGAFSYLVQAVDAEGNASVWSAPRDVVVSGTSGIASGIPDVAWRGLELAGANPVRSEARLRFTIPAVSRVGERVRLTVHDVHGREIAVLRDGVVDATSPGRTFDATWQAPAASSGLYFARLSVGARSSERKILVLR